MLKTPLLDVYYNPVLALGTDLLGYWDANRKDLITIATGVSSWKDIVAGYDAVQAVGAAQPIYDPYSFNGQPGVLFDGIDDELTFTPSGQFPANADPCELWALCSQDALVADVTNRAVVSYGQFSNTNSRHIGRIVVSGVNRIRSNTGDGAGQARTGTIVNMSSRHVVRLQVGATTSTLTGDKIAEGSVASVPATVALRFRLGASPAGTTALFWQGQLVVAMVTNPLTEVKANELHKWLMLRRKV